MPKFLFKSTFFKDLKYATTKLFKKIKTSLPSRPSSNLTPKRAFFCWRSSVVNTWVLPSHYRFWESNQNLVVNYVRRELAMNLLVTQKFCFPVGAKTSVRNPNSRIKWRTESVRQTNFKKRYYTWRIKTSKYMSCKKCNFYNCRVNIHLLRFGSHAY